MLTIENYYVNFLQPVSRFKVKLSTRFLFLDVMLCYGFYYLIKYITCMSTMHMIILKFK